MFKRLLNISTVLMILVIPISILADNNDITKGIIDMINQGQNNKPVSNQDTIDINENLNNFSGGGDKDTIFSKLSGLIGETPQYSLDGTQTFNGQIVCDGETQLGTITYRKSSGNNRLQIELDLESFGRKIIDNIASICSEGVLSKSGAKARGYSFMFNMEGKLYVSSRPDLQNCEGIDIYSNHSATEDDYDMLTGQIIKILSSNTSIGTIVSEKEKMSDSIAIVKLMSQNSILCGTDSIISGSSDLYSYTSPENLYQTNVDGPLSIPDGSSALGDALDNEDSIYYMMNESLNTEYADGVSIGSADNNICTIENDITGVINGFETDGGCSFNTSICSTTIDIGDGSDYSTCVRYAEIKDKLTGSDEFSGICGDYTLSVTKSDGSPTFEFNTGSDKNKVCVYDTNISSSITDINQKLEYRATSCSEDNLSLTITLKTKFKTSNNLSISTKNGCIDNDKKCKLVSEKVCKSDKTDCIQTVENMKRVRIPTIDNETITIHGKDFRLDADGYKLVIIDDKGNTKEFNLDTGLGYSYIERLYTCPTVDTDGLKDERDILEDLLGNYDEDYIKENLVSEECAIPICVVNMITEDRTVVNTDTGETRIDIGNATSIIQEVRSCIQTVGSDKFVCPYDPTKKESIKSEKDDCSCDTEKLMDTIGGTLAGLEVLQQIASGNQTQCVQKEEEKEKE